MIVLLLSAARSSVRATGAGFVSQAAMVCLLLAACGDEGKRGGSAPSPQDKSQKGKPRLHLATTVDINAMAYAVPPITECVNPVAAVGLLSINDWQLDGRLSDWSGSLPQIDDPAKDASKSLDIGRAYISRVNADLAVAVSLTPSHQTTLMIELGGVVVRKGVLVSQQRLLLRWQASAPSILEEWRGTQFITTQDEGSRVAAGADGLEFLLGQRLLGDAVTWPAFWLRVYSRPAGPSQALADSTEAVLFPSVLGDDATTLSFSGCDIKATAGGAFTLQEIVDNHLSRKRLGSDEREFSIQKAAQLAFHLVRFAFDETKQLFAERSLPLNKLVVLATTSNIAPANDLIVDASENATAGLFRPLIIHISDLDQNTKYFPEGEVVRQAASRFIQLHLQTLFPRASRYLRQAWTAALLDHLLINKIGMSYFLDAYLPTVSRFLGDKLQGDMVAPETLAEREAKLLMPEAFADAAAFQSYQRFTAEKAVGFGHLLRANFSSKILIEAWYQAAGNTKDSPEVALGKALPQSANAMTAGWLTGESYHDDYTPSWLGDGDQDGIPAFLERIYTTADDEEDSDHDGWNDIAELITGTEPSSESSRPTAIMPDGSFNDWLQLVPKRIYQDKGVAALCPKAADISHVAAIVGRDVLVLGAHAAGVWEKTAKIKWEVALDVPAVNRQFLVTAVNGAHEVFVKDGKKLVVLQTSRRAMPVARQTIEWVLDRRAFGLASYFNATDGVKLRVRTIFLDREEKFCDETGWISPTVSD